MRSWLVFATACLAIQYAESAILFPEEVPTLTAIIYSLLPPIKLGQDSRFGFGFRVGRNADAQFLIELGPQQATGPLGNESNKRETIKEPRKVWSTAERERFLRRLMDKTKSNDITESTSNANTSMNKTSDHDKQT